MFKWFRKERTVKINGRTFTISELTREYLRYKKSYYELSDKLYSQMPHVMASTTSPTIGNIAVEASSTKIDRV